MPEDKIKKQRRTNQNSRAKPNLKQDPFIALMHSYYYVNGIKNLINDPSPRRSLVNLTELDLYNVLDMLQNLLLYTGCCLDAKDGTHDFHDMVKSDGVLPDFQGSIPG